MKPCRTPWCGTGKGPPVEPKRGRARRNLPLPISTLDSLRYEARRRGLDADELAEMILRNVVADDLFAAIVDR